QSIPDVHEPLVDRHLRRGALLHGLDVSPHRQLGLEVGTSSDEPSDDADTVPTESYLVGVAHLVRPGIAVVVHRDVAVEGLKATQQGVINFLAPGQAPDLRHDAPEFWDLAEGLHNHERGYGVGRIGQLGEAHTTELYQGGQGPQVVDEHRRAVPEGA